VESHISPPLKGTYPMLIKNVFTNTVGEKRQTFRIMHTVLKIILLLLSSPDTSVNMQDILNTIFFIK
jgi:hypothetical protein